MPITSLLQQDWEVPAQGAAANQETDALQADVYEINRLLRLDNERLRRENTRLRQEMARAKQTILKLKYLLRRSL